MLEKQDTRFAVLPEGSNLEGWTERDIEELNDHVRHMLHSRRSKFKRSMKGFGKYVSKRGYLQAMGHEIFANKLDSSWVSHHSICDFDYTFWTCLGTFPDW